MPTISVGEGDFSGIRVTAGKSGAALGDCLIEPDAQRNLTAGIKVRKFRPYVGIGFGRIVPKSRINRMLDLGVQFGGKPETVNDINHTQITEKGANGEDGGIIKTNSKITPYTVLNINLVDKIF